MKIEIEEVIKLVEKFIEDVPKENKPILVKRYIDYGAEYKCPRCEEKIIQHESYYNTGKYCCNCGLQFIWNNGKENLIDELTNMIDTNYNFKEKNVKEIKKGYRNVKQFL